MTQTIYILMPVHNRVTVTARFVDSLSAQTFSHYHLILIDDGSTDGTADMVQSRICNLTVLKGTGKWWWAGSLQQGIDWLSCQAANEQDIVMFANDDITFDPDFLQKAVGILDNNKATLILPYVRNEHTGMPEESGIEADLKRQIFRPAAFPDRINCLSTRGLLMRVCDLASIGRFHTWLLPHYWSDYEFTMRARSNGLKLRTSSELVINLDRQQTGYRSFEDMECMDFLKKYFSKRSVINPIYISSFILLTGPLSTMPINLFRVWRGAFADVTRTLRHLQRARMEGIRLSKAIRQFRGKLKIIVGAASTEHDGWISTNHPQLDLAEHSTFAAIFNLESVANFLAEHVWEHLTLEQGTQACKNCFAYLKPGGLLRIAVPDGFHPDADYITHVKPGGVGSGADDHKVLYNCYTLSAMLESTGYEVRLLEWFDEQGRFHQENWDAEGGFILRSTRFDPRNRDNPTAYTSLIVDAIKPQRAVRAHCSKGRAHPDTQG